MMAMKTSPRMPTVEWTPTLVDQIFHIGPQPDAGKCGRNAHCDRLAMLLS